MTQPTDDDETAKNLRAAALAFNMVGSLLKGTACVIDDDSLACGPGNEPGFQLHDLPFFNFGDDKD